jgi:hypothetical protein
MAMGMPGLEQEHAYVFLRHEARCDDTADEPPPTTM